MGEESIAYWLNELKIGSEDAAYEIWHHCFERLLRIAKRKLGDLPNRTDDEEDLALSAFHSLCRGAEAGRFEKLVDQNDLWQILLVITSRKAANRMKYHLADKRGSGKVRGDSAFGQSSGSLAEGIDAAKSEDVFADGLSIECDELLSRLEDDLLRTIALLRLEGHTNREIARRIGRAESTVDLKLKLIRERWKRDL